MKTYPRAKHLKLSVTTNKVIVSSFNGMQAYQHLLASSWRPHPPTGKSLRTALYTAKITLSVVQPLRIAHFAKVLFKRSKSDPADAHTIAYYGQSMHPESWKPLTPEHQQAKALSRRLKQVQKQLHAEQNHLEHTQDKDCQKDIKAHIKQLKARIESIKNKLQEIMPKEPQLNQQYQLIQTIQGIGPQSGAQIIAELPNLAEFESARQLAAWAGLTPKHHQSGSSGRTKTPISKIGSNNLREAIFFPALVAIRHNPLLRNFRDRMLENGKTKLQAVCAVMRKLLHIIYGMIKHNKPFNINYLQEKQAN